MKNLITKLLFIVPICVFAQQENYSVSSYLDEGSKAPNTHYIGKAWLNGLLEVEGDLNFHITKASFNLKYKLLNNASLLYLSHICVTNITKAAALTKLNFMNYLLG